MANLKRVITPVFRASYANLLEPQETLNGDLKFQVSMVFDTANMTKKDQELWKKMKVAANLAVTEKWPDKKTRPKDLRNPFRTDKDDLPGGDTFVRAASTDRPKIIDSSNQPLTESDEVYSGMFARASVTAFAYDQKGNRGVSFGLNNVLKVKDGERLDGRKDAEEDFEEYMEEHAVTGDSSGEDDMFS